MKFNYICNKKIMVCTSCKKEFNPETEAYSINEITKEYSCEECCEEIMELKGWALFMNYPDEFHIRPVNEPEHMHDKGCHCKPKVVNENGIDIVSHNSFDGRECLEEVHKLLNAK
jgi:hypothetical protein